MQPTDPLQKHIGWAEVGDQEIGIDVQGLLRRLTRNRNGPAKPQCMLAEDGFQRRV
jgi:hypothetical protein